MPTNVPMSMRLELMLHALSTIEGRERLRQAWDGVPEDGGPFQQLWAILTGMALLGHPETNHAAVVARIKFHARMLGDEHTFHGPVALQPAPRALGNPWRAQGEHA